MRRIITYLILGVLLHTAGMTQIFPKLGAQRAGISALTFLKIDVSPRSAGMASANLTSSGDAYGTYWNPAAISEIKGTSIAASNTFWAAGINHAFFSAVKSDEKIGSFGISVASLTTGKMERRTEFQPEGTGEYFYASNTAVGLSYSRGLTDMFSYGVTVKYVNETLAEYTANTAVFDLGFLYRTDFKDLKFAVVLQSFGVNSKLKEKKNSNGSLSGQVDIESYPAPTVFKIGVSMVPLKKDDMSLMFAVQLNHPNDNSENIRLGAEFEYKELFYVRAGYKINVQDQNLPTAGVGLRAMIGRHPLQIDYGVDPTQFLGVMHRIGLSFTINKIERSDDNVE